MKDIKILISSFLIIISFFVWYMYSEEKYNNTDNKNILQYVNIDINKSKIKINNQNENVIILINWQESKESEIKF